MAPLLAHAGRTSWDEWMLLLVPLAAFALLIGALFKRGESGESSRWVAAIERIALALERATKLPAWAVAVFGTGGFALTVAVIGFYWDVSWHIDLGRDKALFTPAHTMILVGLASIAAAGLVGVVFATVRRAEVGLRVGGLRVPWSSLALLVLGGGAMTGFPLDDLWHRFYGIDVTMWGPTHLTMISGASLTPIALWLTLAEARIRPGSSGLARVMHGVVAGMTLTGLSTWQGEFDFGVPQFQLLYHPVLIALAAGGALVAARVALGRFGAIRAAIGFLAIRGLLAVLVGPVLGLSSPHFPLYLGSAVVVELIALALGTERRGRFALAAGLGVATIGLVAEWGWVAAWGQHAWPAHMLRDAVLVSALAGIGAAVLGSALGAVVRGERPTLGLRGAIATLAIGAAVALPFPRTASPVRVDLSFVRAGPTTAMVSARLDPASTAKDARWFEVLSWQGGTHLIAPMVRTAPGRYVTSAAVPVGGKWKSVLRLHRGSDVMGLPIFLPADVEIGAPEVPAVDRTTRFVRDTRILQRESRVGPAWPAVIAYTGVLGVAFVWLISIAFVARRVGAGAALLSIEWRGRRYPRVRRAA